MSLITPHLWFDTQAVEAARFYCSVMPDARITHRSVLRAAPSGDCDIVSFELAGLPFKAISAGPYFTFNPSVSFLLNFDPQRDARARDRLDTLWSALADGGEALMPLDAYPFRPRYGWIRDRYGLSWQLNLCAPSGQQPPPILPLLMFTGEHCGKAEEAGIFYRGLFEGSQAGQTVRYPAGMAPGREGTLMYSDFRLGDTWIGAMDSAHDHGFGFNEAVSFLVACRDQAGIDRYWSQLSTVPQAEQCGWCKDRYGLSWQITPMLLDEVMRSNDEQRIARVTRAFLKMKKFDVAALEVAARG
ncbi:MAG: VOC family protein [Sinimarinibacterium flocculans]|uniref:VOC family protein n=1 Tax=Sinimarinibacterium flocculans TaxID=985250 RepID=UPI003C34DDE0